jgi:hypothetical protein
MYFGYFTSLRTLMLTPSRHRWLDDVVSGRVNTVTELCAREKCSVRQVNMTISLARPGALKIGDKIPAETASFRLTTVSAVREDWMVGAPGLEPGVR